MFILGLHFHFVYGQPIPLLSVRDQEVYAGEKLFCSYQRGSREKKEEGARDRYTPSLHSQ